MARQHWGALRSPPNPPSQMHFTQKCILNPSPQGDTIVIHYSLFTIHYSLLTAALPPQIPICASKNYFKTSDCCHNKSHSISDQTSGILWRKTSVSASPFSCGILTGTPNRNRTCNCPLGGGCYIRLTMGAYSQH